MPKVLVTDCGSTTTKAILFGEENGTWRMLGRGEAPTTVEAPVEDVTIGVFNAFRELEETIGIQIFSDTGELEIIDLIGRGEVDRYLSTSSAGGGLQMVVIGLASNYSAESAERAAMGAGAIVLDVISFDDDRKEHEKIERIRHLKPDIVLLAGGTEGGARKQPLELAEILLSAAPKPRFGTSIKLPVIYSGNSAIQDEIKDILSPVADVYTVRNIRPSADREELESARDAIHELFLSHVMSHSPGYDKLTNLVSAPIMPTPAAVGEILHRVARKEKRDILCVDIGGATTDVFSVLEDQSGKFIFNRSVSANLGMSYSIANVLIESGISSIMRWLPFDAQAGAIRDSLRNKMIRPTTIPQTKEDLFLEHAVCREALWLSLEHHRHIALGIGGAQKRGGIADIFRQKSSREELYDPMRLSLVIGSGGVLSHAPNRLQSALLMLEGFELRGVTQLGVDSVFMLPHLGVFSRDDEKAALEVYYNDCFINLGWSIVPVFRGHWRNGDLLCRVYFDGDRIGDIRKGELGLLQEIPDKRTGVLKVEPANGKVDVGKGMGEVWEREVDMGQLGILGDGRGRPIRESYTQDALRAVEKEIYYNLFNYHSRS